MKTKSKKSSVKETKKLFLTKEETQEVQSRRETLVWIHNLVLHDIQNFLVAVAFPRLGVKEGQKTKVSEDGTYLEVIE